MLPAIIYVGMAVFNSKFIIKALKEQIESIKNEITVLERKYLKRGEECDSKFWMYLDSNRKMMGKCMTVKARQKAGMPNDESGRPGRCYSNPSESVNNILTGEKESVTGNAKEKRLTKLEFIRDVWTTVRTNRKGAARSLWAEQRSGTCRSCPLSTSGT